MTLIWIGALVLLLLLVATLLGRAWSDWGATPEEIARAIPGDRWVEPGPRCRLRFTRAIGIEAPAEAVWPWLEQMGRGAGWYSYDRLDNGGRTSARHLVSWVPPARLGDASPIGYLRHLDRGHVLAWWLRGGWFFGAFLRGVMTWQVTPTGDDCRLVIRMHFDARGVLARPALWLLRIADGIMARRQLIGIKERVERFGVRREDPEAPETGARDQFQKYQAILVSGETAGAPRRRDAVTWRRAAIEDGIVAGGT